MYSNFSKPIRSWVLIIWLNNLNVTCYSSERDYLKFSPSMFTLYPLHPLSALGGWVLGLAMRSLYKRLEREKVLIALSPSLRGCIRMTLLSLSPTKNSSTIAYILVNYYMFFSWTLLTALFPCACHLFSDWYTPN